MTSHLEFTPKKTGSVSLLSVQIVIMFIIISMLVPTTVLADLNETEKTRIIQEFDVFAGEVFNESGVPGMSIAITDRNRTLYSKGFGMCSLERKDPVTPETTFLINSMSKAFTATVIGSMVDEGTISWNDTVVSVLPNFALQDLQATKEMTIGELLTHNSGLWENEGNILIAMGVEPNDIVSRMRYLKMQRPFRSGYGYNNLHYVVASEVINATTHKPWSDSLQTRIFTPLGMNNTSTGFRFLNQIDDPDYQYADHHAITSNGYVPMVMDKEHLYDPYYVTGAGGIQSNVIDMVKWLRLWLNDGSAEGEQILKPETVKDIIRPENLIWSFPAGKKSYAHGWMIQEDSGLLHPIISHGGESEGACSYNGFIPEEGIGIVVLTNTGNDITGILGDGFLFQCNKKPTDTFNYLNFTAIREYLKPQYPESPFPQPGENISYDPDLLTGTYLNDCYGEMQIIGESGNLSADLGPRPLRMKLTPVNSTAFLFSFLPMNGGVTNPDGLILFDSGLNGNASKITFFETVPEEPPFTFTRP